MFVLALVAKATKPKDPPPRDNTWRPDSTPSASAAQQALVRPRGGFEPFPLDITIKSVPEKLWEPVRDGSKLSDNVYSVDLLKQTCTCPDFQQGRNKHQPGTLPRMCKHLLRQYSQHGLIEVENEYLATMVYSGHGGPVGAWLIEREAASNAVVTLSRQGDWLNVLARDKRKGERAHEATGRVKNYGWNIRERRWARGESPPGARELRQILSQLEPKD